MSKIIIYILTKQTKMILFRQFLFCIFALTIDFIVISELMLFGERLLSVRKKKKISQDELAKKLGVHAPVIGRYERNEVKPSIEMAANLANALGVSLDYLVGVADLELDKSVVEKIVAIQQLSENDKNHILKTIDALLRDAQARQTYS